MRKLLPFVLFLSVLISFIPSQAQGDHVRIIPCGGCLEYSEDGTQCLQGKEQPDCSLCHLFVLVNNVITFLLIPDEINHNKPLVPIVAVLFLAGGAGLMVASGGNPRLYGQARGILLAVMIGLVIIYVSWIFLDTFIVALGLADAPEYSIRTWWKIECPLPPP